MTALIGAAVVFIVMGAAWWYDRRLLLAEMREIKRIAQGLLDEIKAMREKYDDTSEIADKILKHEQRQGKQTS